MSGLPADIGARIAETLAKRDRAAAAAIAGKIAAAQDSGDATGFGDDLAKLQTLAGLPLDKGVASDLRTPLAKVAIDDGLYEAVQAAITGRDCVAARALYPRFLAIVEGDPTNASFARALDSLAMLAGDPMAGKLAPDVLARAVIVAGLAKVASTDQERAAAKRQVDALASDIRIDLEIRKALSSPRTMGLTP